MVPFEHLSTWQREVRSSPCTLSETIFRTMWILLQHAIAFDFVSSACNCYTSPALLPTRYICKNQCKHSERSEICIKSSLKLLNDSILYALRTSDYDRLYFLFRINNPYINVCKRINIYNLCRVESMCNLLCSFVLLWCLMRVIFQSNIRI